MNIYGPLKVCNFDFYFHYEKTLSAQVVQLGISVDFPTVAFQIIMFLNNLVIHN